MESNDYIIPFSQYIKNMQGKYAIAITKIQYAMIIGGLTHEGMAAKLMKSIRPDIKMDDWGNAINPLESYNNGNIMILGYPYYMQIELPHMELLSHEQFEKLKSILLEIKNYNDSNIKFGKKFGLLVIGGYLMRIETKEYQDNIDDLINELSFYVQENEFIPNEVIIGEKILQRIKD